MLRKLTHIALLIAAPWIAPAQSYSYFPSTTLVLNQNFNDNTYDGIYFINTSSSSITMNWTLLSSNIASGAVYDICASGNCLNGIPATGTFPVLMPGDTGWLKLHAIAGTTAGTSTITFLTGPSQKAKDTLTFIIHISAPQGIPEQTAGELHLYPNPATTVIRLRLPPGGGRLEICSLTGQLLAFRESTAMEELVEVSHLPAGTYLAVFRSKGAVLTRRFVVLTP